MFFYSCQNLWRFLPKILPYFLVGRRGGLVSRVEWVDSGVEMGASAGQKLQISPLQELATLPNIRENIL